MIVPRAPQCGHLTSITDNIADTFHKRPNLTPISIAKPPYGLYHAQFSASKSDAPNGCQLQVISRRTLTSSIGSPIQPLSS